MQDKEIVSAVVRLRKLEDKGRTVKREVQSIREGLKAEFTKRGVNEIAAGRFTVRHVTYEREQFDAALFRANYPDTYALYCKSVPVSRVDVVG